MAENGQWSFTLESHVPDVIDKTRQAIENALDICGGKAETYAKNLAHVDTGLLRNSITHALGGESPGITYKNNGVNKLGKPVKEISGSYKKAMPKDKNGQRSVYIGTNVEYAPYVELGTPTNNGPYPFIRPALENHTGEYKMVIETELKKVKYIK